MKELSLTREFDINEFLEYIKKTKEESWCTNVVKTKEGKSCLIGHVFDFGGGDNNNKQANEYMDIFEECYATSFMFYPVNDGKHPNYKQETPKQRCVAYVENLINGKEKTSFTLWAEMG